MSNVQRIVRASVVVGSLVSSFSLVACTEEESTPVTAADTGVTDLGTPFDFGTPDLGTPDLGTPDLGTPDADTAVVTDTGGDSGSEKDCIDGTAMDPFFTLADSTKCLVAKYDVATGFLSSVTWGRHGGPLGFEGGATSNLVRYEVPSATTGTLTPKKTAVAISGVPAGAFWGSQAVDLPFFGWTAVAYTTSGAGFPGELILIDTTGALTRYHANGFYAATALGLSSASGGRILYTGVSVIGTAASTTNEGGVYSADSCGSAATTPRLLPGGDDGCRAPQKVATWEAGASGPIAADPSGNVFAVLSKFGGKQEMRGFEKSIVARNSPATAGSTLFSQSGYTTELVADGKRAIYQLNDGATFSALDVESLEYTVDGGGKKITAANPAKKLLQMKKPGTSVVLILDDRQRLWVGLSVPGVGDAGPSASVFFVIRDKKP